MSDDVKGDGEEDKKEEEVEEDDKGDIIEKEKKPVTTDFVNFSKLYTRDNSVSSTKGMSSFEGDVREGKNNKTSFSLQIFSLGMSATTDVTVISQLD